MTFLADELTQHSDALIERAMEAMYANPFWLERYGERGRSFARADNAHHIDYLVQAFRANSPELLERYARWLQIVLTTRGMCTRRLSHNLRHLAEAIAALGVEDSARAVGYLDQARRALEYSDGPAHVLQTRAHDLAATAATALVARHPEWLERWGEVGRGRCADDMLYHLSYIADALALGRNDLFADYVEWIAGFFARRSIPRQHVVVALATLNAAFRELPAETRAAAEPVVAAGLARLA